MNRYSDAIKQEAISLYRAGTLAAEISMLLSISRSTVYKWVKEQDNVPHSLIKSSFHRLENKVKRLEGIIEILQGVNCSVSSPLNEKLDALERLYGKYSVHMLCEALKVPRGTFYNFIRRNKRDNTWYSKNNENLKIVSINSLMFLSQTRFGSVMLHIFVGTIRTFISVPLLIYMPE